MTTPPHLPSARPFGNKVGKILWGWEPAHGLDGYSRTLDKAVELGFDAVSFFHSWNYEDFSEHRAYAERAVEKGLKLVIWPAIHLTLENMEKRGYYTLADTQMDAQGRPFGKGLVTTLSFASPAIHKATDVLAKIVDSYKDLHNEGHVINFAPTTTASGELEMEWGYNGYDVNPGSGIADFNPMFVKGFQTWLMEVRYANCTRPLDALNFNWQTAYKTPDEIRPPQPLVAEPNHFGWTAFSRWWQSWEWYAYRHHMIKGFMRECAEKFEALGGWKTPPSLCLNCGSFYDTMCGVRGSASPADLMRAHPWYNVVKDNPGSDYNIDFDVSLLMGTAKQIPNGYTTVELTSIKENPTNIPDLVANCQKSIDRGVHALSFAFLNPHFDEQGKERTQTRLDLEDIHARLVRSGYWNKPVQQPPVVGEFRYTESEIITKGGLTSGGFDAASSIETRFTKRRNELNGFLDIIVERDVTLLGDSES